MQTHPNSIDIGARFPRLVRHCIAAALLTRGEAIGCIAAYRRGDDGASEAVDHFGGTRAVVSRAFKGRKARRVIMAPIKAAE